LLISGSKGVAEELSFLSLPQPAKRISASAAKNIPDALISNSPYSFRYNTNVFAIVSE
jgi:hypothetical protein